MIYPHHLLPQYNYKNISYCDELEQCFLIRHTKTKDIYLEGTERIDPDKLNFQSDHLSDLSTNLLGIFQLEDIYIQVINNELVNLWYPNENIRQPKYGQDFIKNLERGYFIFHIKEIERLNSNVKLHEIGLTFKVLHTPTTCNFWHFSVRVFKNNIEVKDLDIRDKEKKQLWRTAKIQLIEIIFYSCFHNTSVKIKL